MSAYLVGQANIKSETLWNEYVLGVKDSLIPYEERNEASLMFRGKRSEVVSGENTRNLVVVIEFKNHAVLQSWFRSVKYQSLIELREKAADVVITFYDDY